MSNKEDKKTTLEEVKTNKFSEQEVETTPESQELMVRSSIQRVLKKDELPDIVIFKDRTDSKGIYSYLSKHTGTIKKTDFSGITSKVREQLWSFDFYENNPIALVKKGITGYNLIEENIRSVDEVIFNPTLPFGIVTDSFDKAFKVFNYCKQSPVKQRLLAEIKEIKSNNSTFIEDDEFSVENIEDAELDNDYIAPIKRELCNDVEELYSKLQTKYSHTYLLIKNILGGDNISPDELEKRVKYFLNWIARATRPEEGKCCTALVFRGGQGTGKTAFFELYMDYLFSNYMVFDNNQLASDFQEGIDRADFIVCEEVEISDKNSNKVTARLKEFITNKTTNMNVKNLSAKNVRIWFNMVFLQNPVKPIKFETDDRRYTCFVTSDTKLLDLVEKEFGYEDIDSEYFGYIKKNERDDFLMDLLNIKYNKAKTERVLMTPEKLELMAQTNASEVILADLVKREEYAKLFENGYVTTEDLKTDKEAVVNFYIEAKHGYLSPESRNVFAYFSLLHKKASNNSNLNISDITQKEGLDLLKKGFPKAASKKIQSGGKRRTVSVLDNTNFSKDNYDKAQEILSDKDERFKLFLELIGVEYNSKEELRKFKIDMLDVPY